MTIALPHTHHCGSRFAFRRNRNGIRVCNAMFTRGNPYYQRLGHCCAGCTSSDNTFAITRQVVFQSAITRPTSSTSSTTTSIAAAAAWCCCFIFCAMLSLMQGNCRRRQSARQHVRRQISAASARHSATLSRLCGEHPRHSATSFPCVT